MAMVSGIVIWTERSAVAVALLHMLPHATLYRRVSGQDVTNLTTPP